MIIHLLLTAMVFRQNVTPKFISTGGEYVVQFVIPDGFRGAVVVREGPRTPVATQGSSPRPFQDKPYIVIQVPKSGQVFVPNKKLLDSHLHPGLSFRILKFKWASGPDIPFYRTGLEREITEHNWGDNNGEVAFYIGTAAASDLALRKSMEAMIGHQTTVLKPIPKNTNPNDEYVIQFVVPDSFRGPVVVRENPYKVNALKGTDFRKLFNVPCIVINVPTSGRVYLPQTIVLVSRLRANLDQYRIFKFKRASGASIPLDEIGSDRKITAHTWGRAAGGVAFFIGTASDSNRTLREWLQRRWFDE